MLPTPDSSARSFVYGDSVSDNGNLFALTCQPGPPYVGGRASNGPVAVEDLAAMLGSPLLDYALGGATTGIGNHLDPGGSATTVGTFNLPGMTTLFTSSIPAVTPLASTALFVVFGGSNDFLSPSPQDNGNPLATANRAVANLVAIVDGLEAIGAKHILVPGLPDLGLTPFLISEGSTAAANASALTDYFDAELMAKLPGGATYFDTAGLLRNIVANPATYGFTNVTDACYGAAAKTVCANPNQYLFFDDLHPSAQGHVVLAEAFAAAVPEPSTWMLLGCTLICAAPAARRLLK